MPETDPSVRVVDNPDRNRYEAYVQDSLAGFVTYRTRPGVVTLVHTEVDRAFEGHGVGGRLAAGALEDARARGVQVEPLCPFIVTYLRRHPEFADLVLGSRPAN
jgi:predicted GNAT family acetyltransferase